MKKGVKMSNSILDKVQHRKNNRNCGIILSPVPMKVKE